jgi:hypothetical protein
MEEEDEAYFDTSTADVDDAALSLADRKKRDEGRIRVAVRVRPISDKEVAAGVNRVVDMEGRTTTLRLESARERKDMSRRSVAGVGADETTTSHSFKFDYSFFSSDPDDPNFADQEDVFQCIGKDLVANTLQGYNSTIFSYGQTGSGKT